MEHIGESLKGYKPKVIQQVTRGQWVNRFFYKLEKDWLDYKPEPLPRYIVATVLKQFPDWELPVLWSLCEEANNFAVYFWWRVKKQKEINVRKPSGLNKKPKNLTLKLR